MQLAQLSEVSRLGLCMEPLNSLLNCCDLPPSPKEILHNKVFFHQSGQSPKIIRAKGVGLERTDSQTVGEFQRGRRKGRYSKLNRRCDSPFFDLFKLYLILSLCMVFHWCIVGFLLFVRPCTQGPLLRKAESGARNLLSELLIRLFEPSGTSRMLDFYLQHDFATL